MRLEGARVLVTGMGKSGVAACALLVRKGAVVTATDLEAKDPAIAGVRFELQRDEVFLRQDLIVLSPGVPADLPAVESARAKGIRVIGEVELAGWFLRGRVIGITGSNGKTTTTALIGHILKESGIAAQVGGNIGLPPTAMIDSSRDDQWNVLELSSFQLETTETFRVHCASVLNVTPNHLDRHYALEQYAAAKGRIFRSQERDDLAILNRTNARSTAYAAECKGRVEYFSAADIELLMPAADVPLRGLHNLENVMAAAKAAAFAGVKSEQIAAAVRTFPGVEHRLEFVREWRGVKFYNDSKATSVDAALKALASVPGPLWVILGGKDKGSDYRPLREPLAQTARAALLIGKATPILADHLRGALPLVECGSLDRAVAHAAAEAKRGDTVLLAPACASFDQFTSFEHRGRVFKELVGELEER